MTRSHYSIESPSGIRTVWTFDIHQCGIMMNLKGHSVKSIMLLPRKWNKKGDREYDWSHLLQHLYLSKFNEERLSHACSINGSCYKQLFTGI